MRRKAAVIPGGGIVPAPLLADLIARGAKVVPVRTPGPDPEPRYRPSTALDRFVRARDLTCRFPGCNRPAEFSDLDHTIPYPQGLTHASGLGCRCRKHHLLKTFWDGWSDQQLPDGTLLITTPAGITYTTKPGAALLFPGWNITTPVPVQPPKHGPPRDPDGPTASDARTLMMPKRKRTRAQARASRIKAERALNDAYMAERNIPPPF